jgi:DNA excision repair protein ERCC-2
MFSNNCSIFFSATLEYALENGKKIVYATRTNAQQRQVILELRSIRDKNPDLKDFLIGVGMQGRANMCLLARNDNELSRGTSEELSRFCSGEKKKIKNNILEGCRFYRNFIDKEKTDKNKQWFKKKLPTAEEFIIYCEKKGVCPYEINKVLIKESNLVVVPYVYVFDLMIRNMLLDSLIIPEDDIILVVDEAHNLPDYIRDLYSSQLSLFMLNSCSLEAEKYGDPSMLDGRITVSGFCNMIKSIVSDLRDTYVYGILEDGIRTGVVKNTDAFIPSHEFETEIIGRLKITSKNLHDIISDVIAYGEKIQEYRQKEGKLPRSLIHSLGVFLDFWMSLEMEQYVKLIVDAGGGNNPCVEAYCLDPSLGTEILNCFHSTIHMSGTLEPLEEYRDSIGLHEKTELVSFRSSFPSKNRRVLFVDDVSTKYDDIIKDESMINRMIDQVTSICNNFPKNTMVFFPSFNIMNMFRFNDDIKKITRSVFFEEQKMSQSALMDLVSDFKDYGNGINEGAALFSVMGGRISEGMDFPAEQLEIALIVGIPYPKPTARQRGLKRYYDLKFRKGWEYTVEAPTARKLLQSIGRLIRDEKDRGIAVILDRRAPRFKKYITDLVESKNVLEDIQKFLDR